MASTTASADLAQRHLHPTHTISALIAALEKLRSQYGDMPIVYWDQFSSCTFSKSDDMLSVRTGTDNQPPHLYFGGQHMNASMYCSKNSDLNCESGPRTCDFEDEAEVKAPLPQQ